MEKLFGFGISAADEIDINTAGATVDSVEAINAGCCQTNVG